MINWSNRWTRRVCIIIARRDQIGGPAAASGRVSKGDILWEVDGSMVYQEDADDMKKLVLGQEGTSVRFAHPTPHTLHPALCALHPAPYTLHPTPHNLHPTQIKSRD